MDDEFVQEVLSLYREGKWQELLKLNEDSEKDFNRKLLWVWPSVENLKFIQETVEKHGKSSIISVGCGCGLLEWILRKYSGMPVIGYEVNQEWWTSKYCNPPFIDLQYPEIPMEENSITDEAALLFCYFNDGEAFVDYIKAYKGNLVFIIGPGDGKGTHTEPEPFKPNFGGSRWKLIDYMEVKNTKDYIAVYFRDISAGG